MASYQSLLSADPPPAFAYIEPPFEFNSQNVSKYPPEVTGSLVLNSISRRLGWPSLAGMRLLDLGCGRAIGPRDREPADADRPMRASTSMPPRSPG